MSDIEEHNQHKIVPTATRVEYTPTQWVNDVTKLNESNMNNLESGITLSNNLSLENASFLDELQTAINENTSISFNSSTNQLTITIGRKATEQNPTRYFVQRVITITPNMTGIYEGVAAAEAKLQESKEYTDNAVANVMRISGNLSPEDFPENPSIGDTYNDPVSGSNFTWNGNNWDKLSETIGTGSGLSKSGNTISSLTTATDVIINIKDD